MASEKVLIKVVTEDDVGRYMLFASTEVKAGSVSPVPTHVYWFPDQTVSPGDFVVLHSRSGVTNHIPNETGTNTHNFFWKKNTSIWNQKNSAAVLLKISEWEYKTKV